MEQEDKEILRVLSNMDKIVQHGMTENPMDHDTDLTTMENNEDNDNEDDNNKDSIDIIDFIDEVSSSLLDKNVDICVCERELECKCKDECLCDDDDFHVIQKKQVTLGSNNNLLFEFRFDKKTKLSKKKNLRIFSLNNETEEETPIMDLIRVYEKKKLREEKLFMHQKRIIFPMFDGVSSVKSEEIFFKVNYMMYDQ